MFQWEFFIIILRIACASVLVAIELGSTQQLCTCRSFPLIIVCLCSTFHRRLKMPSLTEVGLFTSCLRMLSSMLADNVENGGEIHIERLFLFCLLWTVGGLLDASSQKGFSDLLMKLSPAYV